MIIDGTKHLPPLQPARPLANIRLLAAVASAIAAELHAEVNVARHAGNSWDVIAIAVRGHHPNGVPCALGDLFAGGTSTTTIRNTYGALAVDAVRRC